MGKVFAVQTFRLEYGPQHQYKKLCIVVCSKPSAGVWERQTQMDSGNLIVSQSSKSGKFQVQ